MLKYYKNIPKSILVCYVISIIAFLMMFALSYAVLRNIEPQFLGTANIILMVLSLIIVGSASYFSCNLMKSAVAAILPDNNPRPPEKLSDYVKRSVSFPLLMTLVGFAISFWGGIIVSYLIDFTTNLRIDDFLVFCTAVKIPLFIGFLVFLILLVRHTGSDDAATKSFNPHFMLIVLIFSFAFMMPITMSDHMYDNNEAVGGVSYSISGSGRARDTGKIIYNVQTVFSSNVDLYKDNNQLIINEDFNGFRVVLSILLSTAIQVFLAMIAYNIGRIQYQKSRPSLNKSKK